MTVSTLRPNSTTGGGGIVIPNGTGPPATVHAGLSDQNFNTGAQFNESPFGSGSAYAFGGLTDFTLPAGAVIKLVRVIHDGFNGGGGTGYCIAGVNVAGVDYRASILLTYNTGHAPTQVLSQAAPTSGWTDADMDGMTWWLQAYYLSNMQSRELSVEVVHVAQPVTDVTAPTGTLTGTNKPLITWANTLDSDGGTQTNVEVKIFSAAQYGAGGFDPSTSTATQSSGVQSTGATSYTFPSGLTNATYRAYVRVAQTVNGNLFWSAWDFLGFTISVTVPAAPNLTATGDNTNGRNALTFSQSGTVTVDHYELETARPPWPAYGGGTAFISVRTLDGGGTVTAGSTGGTIWDYEAMNGGTTIYRGRAIRTVSGAPIVSDWRMGTTVWSS